MAAIKPTNKEPISPQSEKFEKDFKKTMIKTGAPTLPPGNPTLNEVDNLLNEKEQSLKKKIFSLAKMEALVFSDPKLSAVYEDMAENGEEKYGYHYNETIQNMIFNDYVLNSPTYLQKYKMAIPKEKKRRDKSGINKLKKAGQEKMAQSGLRKEKQVTEGDDTPTKVMFLVNERDPEDTDLFAYFPEENHDREGKYKTAYSHMGQHSSASPEYAKESRQASPEEYADLKAELEGIGYNLVVLNGMQESTSAGSAGGAAGYVGYAGPAAFSKKGDLSGDFKKSNRGNTGKAKPINKPISKVVSIGESKKNYITDPTPFKKYIETLNEESDAQFVLNNSQAYGSIDNMNSNDQKIIKKDIQNRKFNNNSNIKDGIALKEGINPDMYSTKEDLKQLIQSVKQRTGKGLTRDHIPMLAGEALYTIAIQLAGQFAPFGWDDLPDTNSMWDYIDENGGMTFDQLKSAVKEAVNDRLSEEGFSLDDMPGGLDEKAKSKAQQRFMGMVNAYKGGELSADDVSADIERAADSMTDKEVDDFARTKHKGLPDHVDENLGQPDVDYLVKAYEILNSGPHYDPAKAEAFKNNLMQMDDSQAQEVSRRLDGMVRQMGYTDPQQVMNFQSKFNEDMNNMIQEDHLNSREEKENFIIAADAKLDPADPPTGMEEHYWRKIFNNVDDATIDMMYRNIEKELSSNGIDPHSIVVSEDTQTMIQNNGTSMSNKAQAIGDMSSEVPQGAQQSGGLNEELSKERRIEMIKKIQDVNFNKDGGSMLSANYLNKLSDDELMKQHDNALKNDPEMRMKMGRILGLNESDMKLLEDINKELEAFSIHHDKLKLMSEDKKTPSMIQGDRLRAENPKNFKKDFKNSDTKKVIDVEKELMWKDQQTDVGTDPQKLGADIEKNAIKVADMKSDEALKNVGDSTNNEGDEIPKRNLTTKEQEEVDLYRNGQHSLNYNNEPSERFVERMKADQGEFFEMGEKQKEFKADAPMYDKDSQPIDDGIEKVQFDKNVKKKGDKVAWNERMGIESNVKLSESMITGRYKDALGKSRLMEFRLGEVEEVEAIAEHEAKMSFDGLGNTYMSKTIDKKVVVNEGVVDIMENYQFYTNGEKVFSIKNPVQSLNESDKREMKPVVNEQIDKMKHLLGYKPEMFVSTKGVKQNRKF